MKVKPFDYGPDRDLVVELHSDGIASLGQTGWAINYGLDDAPESIDGYILAFDTGRVLVAFDEPQFEKPCWLPEKYLSWLMVDPSSYFGLAAVTMPGWMRDNLDIFYAAALKARQAEERAFREAEKEAQRKRQQRDSMQRMGKAAKAAKEKAGRQGDLFGGKKK